MNFVYLLLGSNLNNRIQLLEKARNAIAEKIGRLEKHSGIYESLPWGFEAETKFLNQVVVVRTHLTSIEILEKIKDIEGELGRERIPGIYTSRTIDIDILFFNNDVVDIPDLTIPHKHIHTRKFTLLPLAEIASGFIHPVFNKSILDLLNECKDKSEVKLI
ncbi:MAG: 2-amino-4-hydroxy-6-hydroxymethyldihydropteridine diphosphokinase [Bacteroidetes bacterium GWA2_31_9b]|nr:MAG: 2-amino-4-hydroxy-6-hydroxymethyldihydropteridine diphosphokinase [Bacteroidetes bacterium GWA2_31_9b]